MRSKVLLLMLLAALCTAGAEESITVGAEDDWFPYSGRVDGKAQGISVDIVRAAFALSGVDVKFEVMPYARCMAQTRKGELLACFDTLRHPGLEADYLWHEPAMFKVQYKIYAQADSTQSGLRPADLEGQRVAVTHAYEYGPDFDTNPHIRRVFSLRDESNFRMLLRGRADYTVALEINTQMLQLRKPDLVGRFKIVGAVAPSDVHMVFSRRRPEAPRLMALFEKGLRELHANGRIKAIEAEWFRRALNPVRPAGAAVAR